MFGAVFLLLGVLLVMIGHRGSVSDSSGYMRLSADRVSFMVIGGDVMEDRDLWSVAEVAVKLQVSARSVRRYIASGRLAAVRFGRGYRVASEALTAFLEASRVYVVPRGSEKDLESVLAPSQAVEMASSSGASGGPPRKTKNKKGRSRRHR